MAIASTLTGLHFRNAGGRANSSDQSLYYNGTEVVRYNASQFGLLQDMVPVTSDGAALGTTSLMWSDLFLASGAVVNFNNGDVSLTHSSNNLALDGGDFHVLNGFGIIVGHTAQLSVSGAVPEVQIQGTASADSRLLLARFSADASAPEITFLKSRNATIASNTIVADGDALLRLNASAADGADYAHSFGLIQIEVDDATPAQNTIGTAFVIELAPPEGNRTEYARLDSFGVFRLKNAQTAPSGAGSSTNQVGLYSEDVSSATVLGIECETAVAADAEEAKFSNKLAVRINGATYYIMLTVT